MSGTGFAVSGSTYRYGYRLTDAVCSVCGKEFLRSPEWVYKSSGKKYQCSYKCYRVLDRKERDKYNKALDRTLASLERSSKKLPETRARQLDQERLKRTLPEYRLKVAQNRARICQGWVDEYRQRANVFYKGEYKHRYNMKQSNVWARKLRDAQAEIASIEKELEAKENVHTGKP